MIVPEPENVKAIAKRLLDLADNPMMVEYVMWPEPGFRVPEDLAEKFTKSWDQPKAEVLATPESTESPDAESEPAKRKPGRPKKIVEGQ